MGKSIIVGCETLGRGDGDLGARLMGSFLRTLAAVEQKPSTIIFYNSGVRLVADDSPVLDALEALDRQGVELAACGTCLAHFGLQEKVAVGRESNMQEIISVMLGPGETVTV
jgi:selenium metabolism protein YedF